MTAAGLVLAGAALGFVVAVVLVSILVAGRTEDAYREGYRRGKWAASHGHSWPVARPCRKGP